ncbi:helix-turn-helix domain-containing protein [Actinophytocola sp.]|uniref:helix-turn-helix domain-containing protein n=1 Tax=Actinophytocola sp. TaxID=1872138 RepID=UPI002D2A9C1C|nr:helix-turn-helix domain-containing protein [Actinophytocola sp.]HYQ62645.1 helix-turn-helix domain-containing protein [Actinophytocola sp.]
MTSTPSSWSCARRRRCAGRAGAQQGLAEALGLTRVSVNRALGTLADEGLVAVEPGAVVVLAPELLTLRAKST